MAIVTLTGLSGLKYQYTIADPRLAWLKVGGNYVFLNAAGTPVYVGITENFDSRRPGPSHDKWAEACRKQAVYVAAHRNDLVASREAEEADLIRAYNPPCNVQHRLPERNGLLAFGFSTPPRKATILGG